MATPTIPNPPNAPDGYVADWDGSAWTIIPISSNFIPAYPANLPAGYTAVWDGSEWDIIAPPAPPPAPTPDEITKQTIETASGCLISVSYLTTSSMQSHITEVSYQEAVAYVDAVANILATAQSKYGTGEAYAPDFPVMPSAVPPTVPGSQPYIQFVVVN